MGRNLAEFSLQPQDVGCLLGWEVAEEIKLELVIFTNGGRLVVLMNGLGRQKLRFV